MKKIVIAMFSLCLVFSLFACSEDREGKLIMATNAEFPPYEYKENKEFKGIEIEMANIIAEKLGKELKVLDIAFDAVIPSVTSGKADIGLSGITVTEERKENVDFSDTYINAVQAIIVPNDSPIGNKNDLEGKTIGVQTGTTGDLYATGDFGDAAIKRYNKIADAVLAVKSGGIDCAIIDDQVAIKMVKENEGLKVLNTPYETEEYAIAIKKGNTELLEQINAVLAEMKQDGSLNEIINKYIN